MKILVAGVGNIFLGDDAFGVEMIQRLRATPLPPEVTLADFGIRSFDLAYAIADGYDVVILVDAISRGESPGTVSLVEPEVQGFGNAGQPLDAHSANPQRALELASSLGGDLGSFYLIGCEPAVLETEDGQIGLSEQVEAAIPNAIQMLLTLLQDLLRTKQNAKLASAERG